MKYIVALREPPLATLWLSQVMSGLGDQLYMLAAMWIAVERFGNQAGYVAAALGIGKVVFGLLGGIIADRFDRRKVLIVSDLVRFLAVAPLSIIASTGCIQLWHLVLTGALMGAFGAFFDPALQASLPSLSRSTGALEAMTGLIDLTQRLARAIGPCLTGALVAVIPITQFFTIEALSFLFSAFTIVMLGRTHLSWGDEREGDEKEAESSSNSIRGLLLYLFRDMSDGVKYTAKDEAMTYCLLNLALQSALWGVAFTVGFPILVKESFGNDVALYGYLVAAYGVGSVAGNVICANLHIKSSWLNVFIADAACGLGFVVVSLTQTVPGATCGAILAAIGGAAGDLLLLNLIMKEVPANLLGKTMSIRMMLQSGGFAGGLVVAAGLFKLASASVVIAWCGGLMVITCMYGAIRFASHQGCLSVERS